MNDTFTNGCDGDLLVRALDDDLDASEKQWLAHHLEACRPCRQQLAAMTGFSRELRHRVDRAADGVDFTALEKEVLTKALRQHRNGGGGKGFLNILKYGIPVAATACLLLFFGYNHFMGNTGPVMGNTGPAPSAIINSFTGSMSSVMIFETPETRQTILWYNEDTDVESESDAV